MGARRQRAMRATVALFVVSMLIGVLSACAASPREVVHQGSPTRTGRAAAAATNPWLGRHTVAITHNGGENAAPGDTLFALQEAHDEHMQVLDVDVQESKDGIPVLIHNDTLDSHTNGTGPVGDKTAAELNTLDAAYWFNTQCGYCHTAPTDAYIYRGVREGTKPLPAHADGPGDFGIATLEEAFQRFPDIPIDIELKPESNTAATVAALIHKYHREDRTIVASFADSQIAEFQKLAPTVATSPGQTAVTNFFLGKPLPPGFQVIQIPYKYSLSGQQVTVLTADFLQRAHAAGVAVWVWDQGGTPGQPFYEQLAKTGVDGILASQPTDLLTVLHRLGLLWDGKDHAVLPPAPAGQLPTSRPAPPTSTRGGNLPFVG